MSADFKISPKIEKIVKVLDEKKAEDIVAIKIDEITVLSDYFVIATGTSNIHIRSLADEIEEKLSKDGIEPVAVEGRATGWILLDYSDVLIHLFTPDSREYYNLERLWTDGAKLDISQLITEN